MKPKRTYNVFPAGRYNAHFLEPVFYNKRGKLYCRYKFLIFDETGAVPNTEDICMDPPLVFNSKKEFLRIFKSKYGYTPAQLRNMPFKVVLKINDYGLNSVTDYTPQPEWALPPEIAEWMAERRADDYEEHRLAEDVLYRARKRARQALWRVLHGKARPEDVELIGATTSQLRAYLEAQFRFGMDWGNYGKVWEIDHHNSLSKARTLDEIAERARYHNLCPLFVKENRAKSNSGV